ncbi:MAG: hypothetical protein ACPGN3_15835 [Opitutales bacterium]
MTISILRAPHSTFCRSLLLTWAAFCAVSLSLGASSLPSLNKQLGDASVSTNGDAITVSTGLVQRTWQWTGQGFLTTSIKRGSHDYSLASTDAKADWALGKLGKGTLLSLSATDDDDEQFTSEHLAVEAEIEYKSLKLKYVIWAYPGAPGLRTQIWLKTGAGKTPKKLGPGISDMLSLEGSNISATAFGYAAGLKNYKPEPEYNILETYELSDGGSWGKASGLILDNGNNGLVLIKESHNHTLIKKPVAVGSFTRKGNTFITDGLGLTPKDLKDEYRFCWANWMVAYSGNNTDAQLALKQFDRKRFPIVKARDMYIMANTWGTEDTQDQAFYKAREGNVLREIPSAADLGIDIVQIDEGWQVSRKDWRPAKTGPWRPFKTENPLLHDGTALPEKYTVYPEGFVNVKQAAKEHGIKLGLWFANTTPLEDLKGRYDEGNFKAFKLDFARLESKDRLDVLYYKGRDLVKYTGHTAGVNWDVTENQPRMGFYFGRECGNIYLANRKTYTVREAVTYIPWRQLRDAWELAKYVNLNKFQITINNKDIISETAAQWTDADQHSHAYNFAITLMSSPIFFAETQYFSESARDELRPIIAKYKEERSEMYDGYVFPIGDRPNNANWSGFQNHNLGKGTGYISVFRELHNKETKANLSLHLLKPGTQLELTDILTGETRKVTLGQNSEISFEIQESPGFAFMKYREI